MQNEDFPTRLLFSLENFEGPLDLLSHLIQKDEIDILEIEMKKITTQYLLEKSQASSIDTGSEFLFEASSLLALKTRKLLPSETLENEEEDSERPYVWIESLIEYCKFKEVAAQLSQREEGQKGLLPRCIEPSILPRPLGLQEVSLESLSLKFRELLKKIPSAPTLFQETWSIEEKIRSLLALLSTKEEVIFTRLAKETSCKEELIVVFLALLELMKAQKILAFDRSEELIFKLNPIVL